jgi:uncharacterized RDD family membrane protein YckC
MNEPNAARGADPYAAPKAAAWAPEALGSDRTYVKSSVWVRLGARVLDSVFGGLVALPFYALFLINVARRKDSADPGSIFQGEVLVGLAISVVLGLSLLALQIYLLHTHGQTLGKKLVKIKIVRSDGSRASFGRILGLRIVVNFLLSIVPFYGLVDILFIFGEQRRCVHDLIADTIVVNA